MEITSTFFHFVVVVDILHVLLRQIMPFLVALAQRDSSQFRLKQRCNFFPDYFFW